MSWKLFIPIVLVAAIWAFVDARPEPDRLSSTPNHLRGTWRTNALDYADRFLELEGNAVVFGLDERAEQARHPVTAVEWNELESEIWYRVHYLDRGEEEQITLRFSSVADSLRLKTRPQVVWQREETLRAQAAAERAAARQRVQEEMLDQDPFGDAFKNAFRGPIRDEEDPWELP